ncbi:MAG: hypothetical protein EBU08_14525, partial [Micrococcales bacterium]|nr:hypothetical protein [Micrococcales bacterium]
MPITVSGTSITFNDATTQTTAGITSAVTSLNGQTGAITNTTLANIGSYIVALARTTAAASYSRGSTISGSNLRYATTYGTNGGTFAVGSGGGEPNSSG